MSKSVNTIRSFYFGCVGLSKNLIQALSV